MADKSSSFGYLPPLTLALVLSYMAVAMPLAVIPPFITSWPGYGNAVAGLVVGCAFISTILTRTLAGGFADRRGGRSAMRLGLVLYTLASAICLVAGLDLLPRNASLGLLIVGRLLLGIGESYTLVGMHGWGIGLIGPQGAGKVLTWTGAAMYGAFAFGGPLGLELYHLAGFSTLMGVCTLLPLIGWPSCKAFRLHPFSRTNVNPSGPSWGRSGLSAWSWRFRVSGLPSWARFSPSISLPDTGISEA
ncbi:MFS transporter [Asaia astilbis]|uniref:MFS transporter n=1 Tax=Asaia astilbis TaxID=610244 RepID=UPI000A844B54|nr:MFS transporter [Asaia astilbis]